MARTEAETREIYSRLKEAVKTNFGLDVPLDCATFGGPIVKLVEDRVIKFLNQRIGHLPDCDLVSLAKLIMYPETKPTEAVEVADVLQTEKRTDGGDLRRRRGRPPRER